MHLYLFNPENDLALANGDANFVPPASARKMAEDLALLPCCWSEPEDYIMIGKGNWKEIALSACRPWGWSAASRQRFLKAGVNLDLLPSDTAIAHIRALSHRRTSIALLKQLSPIVPLPELPIELTSPEAVEGYIAAHPQGAVLKTPWSSSGKGLCWSNRMNAFNRGQWLSTVLRKMGSVIAEPVYNRHLDFAMLFYAQADGQICFAGYSLFETDAQGVYAGNKLLSNEAIRAELRRYISLEVLDKVQQKLTSVLGGLIDAFYTGFLGVDMMVVADICSGGYLLHPCVELNLRMTMGMVARLYYDRQIAKGRGCEGVFRILYSSIPGGLSEQLKNSDRVCLTPVAAHTQYVAVVMAE